MLLRFYYLFLFITLSFSSIVNSSSLCSLSFCKCPEAGKEVLCQCENNKQNLELSGSSVPKQIRHLQIEDCANVTILADSFRHTSSLKSINLDNLERLNLHKRFFSMEKQEFVDLNNFTIQNVDELKVVTGSFLNFPKCNNVLLTQIGMNEVPKKGLEILTDNIEISNNNIGILHPASLYSDASNLIVKNNRIEIFHTGALDASVRTFHFIGNTVDDIKDNGITVACLHGKIVKNIFKDHEGRPFEDVGPEPTCTEDPDTLEDEDNIVYNVVANPTFEFVDNYFPRFSDNLLDFPGANYVPLGSLNIRGNKINCDCEGFKDFATLVDYDYVIPSKHNLGLGDLLFRKEFYNSGLCVDTSTNKEVPLKSYARKWLLIDEDNQDITCRSTSMNNNKSTPDNFNNNINTRYVNTKDEKDKEIIQVVIKEEQKSSQTENSAFQSSSSSIRLSTILTSSLLIILRV